MGFVPDLFILAVLAVVAGVPVAIVLFAALVRRRAKQFGYASTGAYLRAELGHLSQSWRRTARCNRIPNP